MEVAYGCRMAKILEYCIYYCLGKLNTYYLCIASCNAVNAPLVYSVYMSWIKTVATFHISNALSPPISSLYIQLTNKQVHAFTQRSLAFPPVQHSDNIPLLAWQMIDRWRSYSFNMSFVLVRIPITVFTFSFVVV